MSKSDVQTSSAASVQPAVSSVYDFLYHDADRVGSFLAQFDPDGHLKLLTRTGSVADTESTKDNVAGEGGVPGVAKVAGSAETATSSAQSDAAQKTYDPVWANARAFLDYIENNDLVLENPYDAPIGRFVRLQGHLWILDMRLLQTFINVPALKRQLKAGMPKTPKLANGVLSEPELALEMFPHLPVGVQARMLGSNYHVYGGLKEPGLTTSVSDLFLKHGSRIAGSWKMVGILDAQPQYANEPAPPFPEGLVLTAANMGKDLRPLIGRTNEAFGVTPLVIYREAGGWQQPAA